MDLDKFVEDALIGIIRGVSAAQEATGTGLINPTDIMYQADDAPKTHYFVRYGNLVDFVQFDIAVTVSEAGGSEGGGKIKVFASEIGGKLDKRTESTNASRMKFEVPIVLPQSGHFSERKRSTR